MFCSVLFCSVVFGLTLDVATVSGNDGLTSLSHISQGPEHHVWVQGSHFPPDILLQLSQGQRKGRVDLGLEVTPEEEVQRVEIRTARRPVTAPDGLPRHHTNIKLMVQVPHVGECAVTRCSILSPDKSVN